MRVGSLFAGVGGFDLGLKQAGIEVVWQVENDSYCNSVLSRHWPDVRRFEDVREAEDLGAVDLICGGFPCQGLSVAGRREGLEDPRSNLFWELVRICSALAPEWILIENVSGLLHSNGGRDMGTVLGALGDLGYGWVYRVLDSQFFGVPQRRRRVFIVGHSGGEPRPEVLLEPEGLSGDPPPSRQQREDAAGALTARTRGGGFPGTDEACEGYVTETLRSHPRPGSSSVGNVVAHPLTKREHKGPASTKDSGHGIAFSVNQRREGRTREVHGSLHQGSGSNIDGVIHHGVRRLTPLECERLQGFPDNWTEWGVDEDGERVEMSDTRRYQMLGNAVTVPVAKWIGERILTSHENTR